jgi:hypothetical protein
MLARGDADQGQGLQDRRTWLSGPATNIDVLVGANGSVEGFLRQGMLERMPISNTGAEASTRPCTRGWPPGKR